MRTPPLPPKPISELVQEQICPITGSKEALFSAYGITSYTSRVGIKTHQTSSFMLKDLYSSRMYTGVCEV